MAVTVAEDNVNAMPSSPLSGSGYSTVKSGRHGGRGDRGLERLWGESERRTSEEVLTLGRSGRLGFLPTDHWTGGRRAKPVHYCTRGVPSAPSPARTRPSLYHDKSPRSTRVSSALCHVAHSAQLGQADPTQQPNLFLSRTVSISLFIVFWHSTSFPFWKGKNRHSRPCSASQQPFAEAESAAGLHRICRLRRKRRQDGLIMERPTIAVGGELVCCMQALICTRWATLQCAYS